MGEKKSNYNKLIRDKIPEIITLKEGMICDYKILNDEEYLQELDKKIFEEAQEFVEDHSIEELADLMEVIYNVMEARNISMEDVEKARKLKNEEKGLFKNKIYLINKR